MENIQGNNAERASPPHAHREQQQRKKKTYLSWEYKVCMYNIVYRIVVGK